MSEMSCREFFLHANRSGDLVLKLAAVTTMVELMRLGRMCGFSFTRADMQAVSAKMDPVEFPNLIINRGGIRKGLPSSGLPLHYEVGIDDLPLVAQLKPLIERLKIKPASAAILNCTLSDNVLQLAGESPISAAFLTYLEGRRARYGAAANDTREMALINLDEHTEHGGYQAYFDAKVEMLRLLRGWMGPDVRFSGSLWYPPGGGQAWHTNEAQPGWRMYFVDFDGFSGERPQGSFFRYMEPVSKALVTLEEDHGLVRLFKIEERGENVFWHCVVNRSRLNRWSFGFEVSEDAMEKVRCFV